MKLMDGRPDVTSGSSSGSHVRRWASMDLSIGQELTMSNLRVDIIHSATLRKTGHP